jgi:hypothetical protein
MATSTTLQLKIFATKKRLSDGFIPAPSLYVFGLLAVFCPIIFLTRILSLAGTYTSVPFDIPVLSAPINDTSYSGFRETSSAAVDNATLTLALTPTEFIFGDLSAFTTSLADIRNKFIVPHKDGSPQVDTFMSQYQAWQEDRGRRLGLRSNGLLILVPDSRVPINIIIQVTQLLKATKKFDQVILAGGLQ